MCLRYAFTAVDRELVKRRFRVDSVIPDLKPRYNVSPTQAVPVIFNDGPKAMSSAFWGMPATWTDEAGDRKMLFNGRAESIDQKPSFKKSFEEKRCLIPADSFYEWKQPEKRPFRITVEKGLFAFAGIYSAFDEAEQTRACCMITTSPNELISQVHNRMPAILPLGIEKEFLTASAQEAKSMLKPFPAEKMQMAEISKTINSSRNDSADIVKPVKRGGRISDYI